MPKHKTTTNATFTEQVMNRFHETNKIYDNTLNKIHHLFYLTDITTEKKLHSVNPRNKRIYSHLWTQQKRKTTTMKKEVTGILLITIIFLTKIDL